MRRIAAHRGAAVVLMMLLGGGCVDLSRPSGLQGKTDGPPQEVGGTGTGGGGGDDGGVGADDGGVDAGGDENTLLGLGKPCQAATECEAGFCADGVCCNSACLGACAMCAVPAQEGTCVLAPDGEDPWDACPDDGAANCARDGTCDGAGACRIYAATTVCSALACSVSDLVLSRCDGAGACVPAVQKACYPYACRPTATPACRTGCVNGTECTAPSACFAGTCGGISAIYYDNDNFTGRTVARVERNVDFDWGAGSPDATIGPDSFSARWTGRITARFTEMYTFYVFSDDGVRLWIDGVLVFDDFRQHPPGEVSGSIAMTAGKPVSIRMEYLDVEGTGLVRLSWASAQQAREVVPVTALTP